MVLLLALSGCTHSPATVADGERGGAVAPSTAIRLEDATAKSGVQFALGHNGRSPLNILETSGGGCAFLDYDQDGWPDILLVGPHNVALYHNRHDGTFEDVTASSGLTKDRYWMGCAVGDYDGDGYPDIFLTGYGCCALYHNVAGKRFQDVTAASGIHGLDWSMSAAFADFDSDGRLDLYVSQYVKFDATSQQLCQVGTLRSACGPAVYPSLSGKLFKNIDGRRFKAVPWKDTGKTWGVLASDLFGDGRPAIYLANDMMPCDLWRREGQRWSNVALSSSTAYDPQGQLQGGMGVDSGDYDNDGRLDLLVTNFFVQQASLYHNEGNGLFSGASASTGLGPSTAPFVKFGVGMVDLDNDGWLDIFIANGHVRDNVRTLDALQSYAQPLLVFQNQHARFTDVSESVRAAVNTSLVGRGVAIGDYDRDGRMDILVCNLEGPSLLLHNVSQPAHWLTIRLQDTGSNRAGIGARINLSWHDNGTEMHTVQEIRTSGSVMSARDSVAHFGLSKANPPAELLVVWPDGMKQRLTVTRFDQELIVHREGRAN